MVVRVVVRAAGREVVVRAVVWVAAWVAERAGLARVVALREAVVREDSMEVAVMARVAVVWAAVTRAVIRVVASRVVLGEEVDEAVLEVKVVVARVVAVVWTAMEARRVVEAGWAVTAAPEVGATMVEAMVVATVVVVLVVATRAVPRAVQPETAAAAQTARLAAKESRPGPRTPCPLRAVHSTGHMLSAPTHWHMAPARCRAARFPRKSRYSSDWVRNPQPRPAACAKRGGLRRGQRDEMAARGRRARSSSEYPYRTRAAEPPGVQADQSTRQSRRHRLDWCALQ